MTSQENSTFIYVTFIRTTPEKLWSALTDSEFVKKYWFGIHQETQWQAGSPWRLLFPDGRVADVGEIIEVMPLKRIAIRWHNEWNPELKAEGPALCTLEIEALDKAVKLTVTHSMAKPGSKFIEAVSGGWPKILSNLKSLLETGEVVLKN